MLNKQKIEANRAKNREIYRSKDRARYAGIKDHELGQATKCCAKKLGLTVEALESKLNLLGPPEDPKGLPFYPIPYPSSPGVYAIKGAGDFVKLGRSKNIARRIENLQTGQPIPLKLVAVLSRNPDDEGLIKWHMRPFRISGEWYYVTNESIRLMIMLAEEAVAAE